jgi:hypothetical protein
MHLQHYIVYVCTYNVVVMHVMFACTYGYHLCMFLPINVSNNYPSINADCVLYQATRCSCTCWAAPCSCRCTSPTVTCR